MLPVIFGGFAGVLVSAGTPLPVFYLLKETERGAIILFVGYDFSVGLNFPTGVFCISFVLSLPLR